jgi:aspartyl-tRNA(Asn)/glutamyl-tRNA(Gln) amidotransferase subunit A
MDELTWKPAWQLPDLMASGELSPVEVTDHFLARIDKLDPVLRAFSHVDAAGARAKAARGPAGGGRPRAVGPLHGIPISVKEHIAVGGLPLRRLSGPRCRNRRRHDSQRRQDRSRPSPGQEPGQ